MCFLACFAQVRRHERRSVASNSKKLGHSILLSIDTFPCSGCTCPQLVAFPKALGRVIVVLLHTQTVGLVDKRRFSEAKELLAP